MGFTLFFFFKAVAAKLKEIAHIFLEVGERPQPHVEDVNNQLGISRPPETHQISMYGAILCQVARYFRK